jgi:hypothetical protein
MRATDGMAVRRCRHRIGVGCTSIAFSARDDSELYGLLDRIQDVALHLISLNQIGGSSPAT